MGRPRLTHCCFLSVRAGTFLMGCLGLTGGILALIGYGILFGNQKNIFR